MRSRSGSQAIGWPRRPTLTLLGAGLTGAILVASCSSDSSLPSTDPSLTSVSAAPTTEGPAATDPPETAEAAEESTGPAESTEGPETTVVTAAPRGRVDLAEPTFSNPTAITNPRFPIAVVDQVIQLGEEAGATIRNEVTLLPETKVIEWNGQQVETLVSQFVAYEDGQILEIAVDYFAQDDAGSVWYFGENVANYVDGVVDNTEGTWLAGQDGPPGMIMPADPQVGDVYRPENIPGLVFEEVTVTAANTTVDGPTGPVEGAVVVEERSEDGALEDKTFAPGYGEFAFAVEADQEVAGLALAVPTDAVTGDVPVELTTLSSAVDEISAAAAAEDWAAVSATLATMTTAWETVRAGDVPPLLETQMSDALDDLAASVDDQDTQATSEAAIGVSHASLDLQLQFRARADVDQERLDLWIRQLDIDQAAGDDALVAGDQAVIEAIRHRIGQTP